MKDFLVTWLLLNSLFVIIPILYFTYRNGFDLLIFKEINLLDLILIILFLPIILIFMILILFFSPLFFLINFLSKVEIWRKK